MTDAELYRIEQEAGTPENARRALFEAGRKAEREGDDDIDDAADYLKKLNGNYEVRA